MEFIYSNRKDEALIFGCSCGKKIIAITEYKGWDGRNKVFYVKEITKVYDDDSFYGTILFDAASVNEAKRKAENWWREQEKENAAKKFNVKYLPVSEYGQEFYPTPSKLAGKLLSLIDWKRVSTILEPSAGKGDLAEYTLKRWQAHGHRFYRNDSLKDRIDVIEPDENLQYILLGKEYHLVHDDFLSYNTNKRYSLTIMNPPFSNADKHILKALKLAENGGQVAAICNAETIRNACTESRRLLKNMLSEYNAHIEFVEGAFKHSERPTDVEVALIYVDIPEKRQKSYILEGLKKSEKLYAEETGNPTEISTGDWLQTMVAGFDLEAKAGVELIREYMALSPYIMSGTDKYAKPIISLNIGKSEGITDGLNNAVNSYLDRLRLKYWDELFHRGEITRLMTSQMQSEYEAKIRDMADYDFSYFNVRKALIQIQNQCNQGVLDSIENLFHELSDKYTYYNSENIHYYNGWKTNQAHKVGKKAIIPANGMFAERWSNAKCKYITSDELKDYEISRVISDLEKSLNFLNSGKVTFHADIGMAVDRANRNGTKTVEFTYFDATFYKKGTCHIKFHDDAMPLVERMNIMIGRKKNWLPPCYGKVSYDEMDAESKAVVDDFQGKEAYEKVVAEPNYYLVEASETTLPLLHS